MTKWAVLGSGGMLGQELVNLLEGRECLALTRNDCDITNLEQIRNSLEGVDVVINCAAWTAVDDAESNEDKAFAINGNGAENVARVCSEIKAKLIHISTDYVFSGDTDGPYSEISQTGPKSAYGRTKLAGEKAVQENYPSGSFIVRTAWLYGQYGPNFVKTIINLEQKQESISVVDDQLGQPTWTFDLANKLLELAGSNAAPGIYHGTSAGQTTWFNFAKKIFEQVGADPSRVIPIKSDQFHRPAPRPRNSVLSHEAWSTAGITPIENWVDAIESAFRFGAFKYA